MTFQDFNLPQELMTAVEAMGFTTPSPIQKETIPAIRDGRDVLANAQTGSGKTAAFLIPIMEALLGKKRGTTRVLVLAPTRELALQISEHFNALTGKSGLTCAAVYGGVGMNPQVEAFRKGVDLIVATPGRLLDHMRQSYASFSGLEYLVIDEADRMFDMGFLPDMKKILGRIPKARQAMMFSATLPDPIVKLSHDVLKDPVRISIPSPTRAAGGITHSVFPISGTLKMDLLLEILNNEIEGNVLVFTRTKYRADKVAKFLHKNGISSDRIHGNRSQSQRNATLAGFKNYKFRVLVATDIAARGIDIEELRAVVNFDVPNVPEEYIHRVGRTARASATGDALSLVSPEEESDFKAIEKHMNAKVTRKTVGSFNYNGTSAAMPERDKRYELGMDRDARSNGRRGGSRNRPSERGPEAREDMPERRQPSGRQNQPGSGEGNRQPRSGANRSGSERPAGGRSERPVAPRDPRPEPSRQHGQEKSGRPGSGRQSDRSHAHRGHTAAFVPPPVKPRKGHHTIEAADWIERAVIEAEMRKAERFGGAKSESEAGNPGKPDAARKPSPNSMGKKTDRQDNRR